MILMVSYIVPTCTGVNLDPIGNIWFIGMQGMCMKSSIQHNIHMHMEYCTVPHIPIYYFVDFYQAYMLTNADNLWNSVTTEPKIKNCILTPLKPPITIQTQSGLQYNNAIFEWYIYGSRIQAIMM